MRAFTRFCLVFVILNLASCMNKVSPLGGIPSGTPSGVSLASSSNEPFDSYGRYNDSFSDLSGAVQSFENGSQEMRGAQRTRLVFPFGAASNEPLSLQATEDQNTTGFDGKLGVLALNWGTVPSTLAYSGFVYQGRISQAIRLPSLRAAKSAEDLDNLQLRFRYKGLRSNAKDGTFRVRCRVEPNIPDAYEHRLELTPITANDQWQQFEAILGDGSNSKAFLQYIASDSFDGNFKIAWSQIGPITDYVAATLLIDDIELGSKKGDTAGN